MPSLLSQFSRNGDGWPVPHPDAKNQSSPPPARVGPCWSGRVGIGAAEPCGEVAPLAWGHDEHGPGGVLGVADGDDAWQAAGDLDAVAAVGAVAAFGPAGCGQVWAGCGGHRGTSCCHESSAGMAWAMRVINVSESLGLSAVAR